MDFSAREALIEAFDRGQYDKAVMDEETRELLAYSLESGDTEVFDAMPEMRREILGKRKRGRPRKEEKEECKAKDPTKCWKHGFAADVLKDDRNQEAKKRDRLNPQPTEKLQKLQDISASLREIGWELFDSPDNPADTDAMLEDIDTLRKEARVKKLDDGFEPYRAYREAWKEYKAIKGESDKLMEAAKERIKREDIRRAEEMLATLKDRPAEIAAAYRKIQEAYGAICDALCSILDERNQNNAADDPDTLEVEKQGYGMMKGESLKEYQKRMRSLGRSREIPETIKKIDSIVAETERRWRSVAGITESEFETVKKNWRVTVQNLMKRSSLATNRGINGLNGILEEHLKSQHDLAKKGKRYEGSGIFGSKKLIGGNESCPRYQFTRKCFGTPRGMAESKYEKYGCLHTLTPTKGDNRTGSQYGSNVIRWKPQSTVATMSCTDSLCLSRSDLSYVNPCLVTDPSPCCFNPADADVVERLKEGPLNAGIETLCNMFGTPYIELQLHGEDQYDADAIESISFGTKEDIGNLSKKAAEAIERNGIPVFLGEKRIKLADYRKGGKNAAEEQEQSLKSRSLPFTSSSPIKLDSKGNIIGLGRH